MLTKQVVSRLTMKVVIEHISCVGDEVPAMDVINIACISRLSGVALAGHKYLAVVELKNLGHANR